MGVVVRRYIDILIIITFPTPLAYLPTLPISRDYPDFGPPIPSSRFYIPRNPHLASLESSRFQGDYIDN